jgi:hypothetical protein
VGFSRQGRYSPEVVTRTLKRAGTEMSLQVLACNPKRVINIVKVEALLKVMKA